MSKPLFIFSFLILSCAAHAEKIDLEVYASKFDSIPIGVIDFRSTNGQKINEEESSPGKSSLLI